MASLLREVPVLEKFFCLTSKPIFHESCGISDVLQKYGEQKEGNEYENSE